MTTDPTIPAVFRGRNVDAVGWPEARPGDYVALRDPGTRADGSVFYITELVDDQSTQLETSFCVNWVGFENTVLDVNYDPAYRLHLSRAFSHSVWQVWRDFGAAVDDDEPVPPKYSQTQVAALKVVDDMITKHARANGLCERGVRAFRAEVNEALGWAALKGTPPSVHVTCDIGFTLEGVSEDDIDVDELASGIASTIRHRTESVGVTIVDGHYNGISFDWHTEDVTS